MLSQKEICSVQEFINIYCVVIPQVPTLYFILPNHQYLQSNHHKSCKVLTSWWTETSRTRCTEDSRLHPCRLLMRSGGQSRQRQSQGQDHDGLVLAVDHWRKQRNHYSCNWNLDDDFLSPLLNWRMVIHLKVVMKIHLGQAINISQAGMDRQWPPTFSDHWGLGG